MIVYNKLVRDRIPEIIESNGQRYRTRTLAEGEYQEHLHTKLQEELDEYLKSREVAELADLMELLYAIAEARDISEDDLDAIRLKKRHERGGFQKRVLLISVDKA